MSRSQVHLSAYDKKREKDAVPNKLSKINLPPEKKKKGRKKSYQAMLIKASLITCRTTCGYEFEFYVKGDAELFLAICITPLGNKNNC